MALVLKRMCQISNLMISISLHTKSSNTKFIIFIKETILNIFTNFLKKNYKHTNMHTRCILNLRFDDT